MEEVVQTLAEEGVLLGERGDYRLEKAPTELHISPTVQGVLAARIDRLEPAEKALLQQLAVIGREFPLGLVREVVTESEDELYRVLSSLQAKEYLYEQPVFPEVEYIFKHALTQEVAYGTVLHEQRKTLHERTGQAMEALYPDTLEDHYGELAHHYSHSDNTEKAVEYLQLAGQRAVQRSANVEAIMHLTQALELLNTLDDTPAHAQQELVTQMGLGTAQMVTKGYGAPEAGVAYTRADELCRQLGDRPEVFDVLLGLWVFHVAGQSELKTARELTEQLMSLARDQNDPISLLKAHLAMATTILAQGDFLAAREHCDQCISLYKPELHHKPIVLAIELDPGVAAHYWAAWTHWLLGYPDQAMASIAAALALAQEGAHAHTSARALIYAACVHGWRGELRAAGEHAQAAVTLSHEYGFHTMWILGTVLHSAALPGHGPSENQVGDAAKAVAVYCDSGAEGFMPQLLATMAEIHGKAGQADEALIVLGEAIEIGTRRGEKF